MTIFWLSGPTILYTIYVIIRLNFFSLKTFLTPQDAYIKQMTSVTLRPSSLYMYMLAVFLILALSSNTYIFFNQSPFAAFPTITLSLITFTLVSTYVAMWFYRTSTYFHSMAFLYTVLVISLTALTNVYQFYLMLEITAYLNLLFISLIAHKNASVSTYYAIIITFILNFISSVLLFSAFTYTTYVLSYPIWEVLQWTDQNMLISVFTTVAILIKMGVGVWLLGNVYNYKGYTLAYLAIYTIGNLLILTPVLVLLLLTYSNTVLIVLSIVALYLIISNTLHTVVSLKSLFAYSTAIFQTYILIIALC